MALGLHGHPGAAAASPVVEEEPQEGVPARLPRLGGSPAWERAKKAKIAKLGNAQVGEISLTRCKFADKLSIIGHRHMVDMGILEQLH